MRPLESSVERRLVRMLDGAGFVHVKLNLQGRRGWPDRLVLIPGGRPWFVELKRPGGRTRKLQDHVHAQLKKIKYEVRVYDDASEAFNAIERENQRRLGACLRGDCGH